MILPVTDLNHRHHVCDPVMGSIIGATNVCRQAGLCVSHGTSAAPYVSKNRHPLCGRAEGKIVLVPRPVSVHGVRAADLSGEPARLAHLR